MSTTFEKAARSVLLEDEGIRYHPYKDHKGNWTIGVGHYIGPDLSRMTLTFDDCIYLLSKDISSKLEDLHTIFGEEVFESLALPRQIALLSWAFTMSRRSQLSFEQMIAAVKASDWDRAAKELLDSDWARDVDPKQRPDEGRDNRLAFMLKTGRFHERYQL